MTKEEIKKVALELYNSNLGRSLMVTFKFSDSPNSSGLLKNGLPMGALSLLAKQCKLNPNYVRRLARGELNAGELAIMKISAVRQSLQKYNIVCMDENSDGTSD